MADKEQATLEEVVKSPAFRKSIRVQIFGHLNRPDPGEGLRFKRTGMDELFDMLPKDSETMVNQIINLGMDVAAKRSRLSLRLRETIKILWANAIQAYFKSQEHGKEEDGSEDTHKE